MNASDRGPLTQRPAARPIIGVVGTRPNYMKMAPLLKAIERTPGAPPMALVHTGQHYDRALNDQLFEDLALRAPDENLGVRSGSHAEQTAEVMKRFDPLLDRYLPSCVVVVGDVNSTLACSLVAAKRGVPVVHVEAGLRSYDRGMPEELNRVLTDQLSSLLFTTEREAHENLAREGIAGERVVFVGNLMIDSLLGARERAVAPASTLIRADRDPAMLDGGYALVTLHRPSNVDDPVVLRQIVELLLALTDRLAIVWPLHPRTRSALERFGLMDRLQHPRIACCAPQGYLAMIGLMQSARVAITDSGGVQEETSALGIPCLTLRDNTERPITLTHGSNRLVSRDPDRFEAAVNEVLARGPASGGRPGRLPEGWDGLSGQRAAAHLLSWLDRA